MMGQGVTSPVLPRFARDLGIRCLPMHSEKAAAYMAAGFVRATGRPGICISRACPGANNLGRRSGRRRAPDTA